MLGCFCDVCPLLAWRVCACVKGTQSPAFGSPKCKLFWMMEANMVSNNIRYCMYNQKHSILTQVQVKV